MAGAYNGTLHEKNVNRMKEYYEVSKKNRYRKCMVAINDGKRGKKQDERMALFHGWSEIKVMAGPSLMYGGGYSGESSMTLGIVEYMDGTVEQVYPVDIRFLDTRNYTGDWEG